MITYTCKAECFCLNTHNFISIERQYTGKNKKLALVGFKQYLYDNRTIKNIHSITINKGIPC
jgi:hypothetical protein